MAEEGKGSRHQPDRWLLEHFSAKLYAPMFRSASLYLSRRRTLLSPVLQDISDGSALASGFGCLQSTRAAASGGLGSRVTVWWSFLLEVRSPRITRTAIPATDLTKAGAGALHRREPASGDEEELRSLKQAAALRCTCAAPLTPRCRGT